MSYRSDLPLDPSIDGVPCHSTWLVFGQDKSVRASVVLLPNPATIAASGRAREYNNPHDKTEGYLR